METWSSVMQAGRDTVVTLEFPNGDVVRGKAMLASVSIDMDVFGPDFAGRSYAGAKTWTVEVTLLGQGEPELMHRQEAVREPGRVASKQEWRCGFCGTVNEWMLRRCDGCNAARSFIYG
jgi:hypothetical protein